MDRAKFKAGMESDIHFSFSRTMKMTEEMAKNETKEHNALWLVEEMAELQQALIKNERGFDNWYDILQEIADVQIGLEILLCPDKNGTLYFTRDQFDKAIDVKMDRDYKRFKASQEVIT